MNKSKVPSDIPVGIVGLGLMGSSIAVCMSLAGHPVIGLEPMDGQKEKSRKRIQAHLQTAYNNGLVPNPPSHYLRNIQLASEYENLKDCKIIIESVKEDQNIKFEVFRRVDEVVSPDAIITSNTSAIPISTLQDAVSNPQRFYGLHWMEPAHTTRFLEVICGEKSDLEGGEYLYSLAEFWQKEAVLVRKDIRGFIANRLMYAMYREAMFLVEGEYASVEDVDRACRNVAGFAFPMMGVFRWMDFTGIDSYKKVMDELFPTLSNAKAPGSLITDIVDKGGRGVFNGKGFYEYSEGEKELWEKAYTKFAFEIRDLALQYPHDVVEKMKEEKKSKE
ncbi:3-hydroxyacyl-CoA dehydrogenase family protein [Pleomorphovibrio marinus]|uniref:3-hydroxyacyl-CoA dehydrogenase family protein n=1 Tax=Pleomorphovibrio marinus TaxID=2164132 RepID=UPI000E0C3A3E|nr:3-hydroxyacyl-CoA dehydrogenase family protein [Pleomorphovibrio marinus]